MSKSEEYLNVLAEHLDAAKTIDADIVADLMQFARDKTECHDMLMEFLSDFVLPSYKRMCDIVGTKDDEVIRNTMIGLTEDIGEDEEE